MHNGMHREMPNEMPNCGNLGAGNINLGIKEIPKGKIYAQGPPDDYERVRQLKIKQYKKLLDLGYELPKNIMDEYNLWEYLEEIKRKKQKT